ncbi:Proteasome subunit alpha type-7 [Microtus ochrogaster]|uniref:Proteasome subunit alpha type-7 n=1 Tax=Microtus ochrogaster TaxID=79684 RepID=A0A8J6KXZ8_MICOH|nr:Proteasome subunit alpha type-7 [Microtus ochrogaster]
MGNLSLSSTPSMSDPSTSPGDEETDIPSPVRLTEESTVTVNTTGLTADARRVINRARVECQSHWLTVEDPFTVESITRYIASLKQCYTQSNGCRPFGISALIVGFDFDGIPRLYHTDPSGTYHAWKANAIGWGAKSVREFLEKNYTDDAIETDDLTIRLVIKALLEVVQSGGKSIELAVMRQDQPLKILNPEEIEKYVAEIKKEKEENEKEETKESIVMKCALFGAAFSLGVAGLLSACPGAQ